MLQRALIIVNNPWPGVGYTFRPRPLFCRRSNKSTSCCLLLKLRLFKSQQVPNLLTWDDLEQVLPRVVRVQRELVDFAEAHVDDPLQRDKQNNQLTLVGSVSFTPRCRSQKSSDFSRNITCLDGFSVSLQLN